jgi:hypothetical protein
MGLIRADVEGLSALAASCAEQADVAAASAQFTARMHATAAVVSSAAQGYAVTEAGSAAAVSAVGAAAAV